MQITGSSVLLTGATGGIGNAIASALAGRGANLIVTGRRGDLLEELAARHRGRAVVVDLAVREEVDRLAKEAGEVDILVANAGLPASGTLESFNVQEIDRALDVNLRAPMVLARELAPAMVSKGRGQLLFVSSLLGKFASPGTSVYSAKSTACADSPPPCAKTCAGKASGCPWCSPGSSARRDVRRRHCRSAGRSRYELTRRGGQRRRRRDREEPWRNRCRTAARATGVEGRRPGSRVRRGSNGAWARTR